MYLNEAQRNERINFVNSLLETESPARVDADFLARNEAFQALLQLAIEDYGVSIPVLASLLGIEIATIESWVEEEKAPSLSLRIRTSYLIALLIAGELITGSELPHILVSPEMR